MFSSSVLHTGICARVAFLRKWLSKVQSKAWALQRQALPFSRSANSGRLLSFYELNTFIYTMEILMEPISEGWWED